MIYRRRDSALHAARASVGAAFSVALVVAALVSSHPLVLAAILAAAIGAGLAAGVGCEMRTVARFAVPLGIFIAAVNPLVTRDGLTVIARLGDVPPLGQLDVTLEATVAGGVLGLRAVALVMAFALYSAAVDPDELLRVARRFSPRSALTAAVALRMVAVLQRDAARMSDARRCRPGTPPPRRAVLRAVATNALDRAVDVAATLEVRGYGGSGRPRRAHVPWSRHDFAFAAATVAVLALSIGGRLGGVAGFHAYPRLSVGLDPGVVALAAAILICALAPFLDRRGIAR